MSKPIQSGDLRRAVYDDMWRCGFQGFERGRPRDARSLGDPDDRVRWLAGWDAAAEAVRTLAVSMSIYGWHCKACPRAALPSDASGLACDCGFSETHAAVMRLRETK